MLVKLDVTFNTRYLEHIHDIRCSKDICKYANHRVDHQHEYGKKEEAVEILKVINKGNFMDIYERCYILKCSKMGICLNEQYVSN
jgi:hypothetical protein